MDKGNATIIMNKQDYVAKMLDLLVDSYSYKTLPCIPCAKILKKFKASALASSFGVNIKKRLVPSREVTPRIFGLQKIHKEGIPLRPIVDTIGSLTYPLAVHLAKLIFPLVRKSNSFVKDLTHFIKFIKDAHLDSNDVLVSFNVVSLFTKVPIPDSIEIVKHKTNIEITSLVELCLKSTFFSFQGVIYKQVDSVAMGSPLSPIIANLYMEHFEELDLWSWTDYEAKIKEKSSCRRKKPCMRSTRILNSAQWSWL